MEFLQVMQVGSFFAKAPEEHTLTLATCGNDNKVKVLYFDKGSCEHHTALTLLREETLPAGHTDIVRGVAWAPLYYNKSQVLASCGNDGKVIMMKRQGDEGEEAGTWTQ